MSYFISFVSFCLPLLKNIENLKCDKEQQQKLKNNLFHWKNWDPSVEIKLRTSYCMNRKEFLFDGFLGAKIIIFDWPLEML